MKLKVPFFLLISFLSYQCNFTQDTVGTNKINSGLDPDSFEQGKCYAKCLAPNQYTDESEEYVVYIGDESQEEVDVETVEIEVKPGGTKWVKKKMDKNCRAPNPDDCLVWCLEDSPAEIIELKILKDTSQSKNYEIRTISKQSLEQQGGFTEWREVLCERDVTLAVVTRIQSSLRELGYYDGQNARTAIIDAKTKASLTAYQKDHQLPVGNLDLETLDALGLEVY